MSNDYCRRIERLKDLEAVKWVTGCDRQSANVARLTAEQITAIADTEMYQPYPGEPGTWASLKPTDEYSVVMAIVATEASERGAAMVASGETYTVNQVDGIAIGCYAEQQRRLSFQTGQCSEGCSLTNVRSRSANINVDDSGQICRHTMAPCASCHILPLGKRLELLERLLLSCRKMLETASRIDGICEVEAIVDELTSERPPNQ